MTRVCEWCGEPYAPDWRRGTGRGRRFCSTRCYRAAPQPPRAPRPLVIPSPAAVLAEMHAAYDALSMALTRGGAT